MPRGARALAVFLAAAALVSFIAQPRSVARADDDYYPDAYPVGVASICDGRQLEGATLIEVTSAPGSVPVDMAVYLDYIGPNGSWARVAKKYAVQHAVVYGATDWSVNFTVPLDGLPATTTTVRPVIEVTYPDMDGGQTVIATHVLEGSAAACPAVAPDAGDPWTHRYEVRLGDSLSAIAGRYGIPAASLASANGLGVEQVLYVGQMLTIPPKATPTAVPTVAASTPVPPASVGLGSPAHATATPRIIVATPTPGAKTPTPEPTATATPTETDTPEGTATITPTPTAEAGAAGAIVPGESTGEDPNNPSGGSPLSILDRFLPVVFGLILLVALVGSFIVFRIWREGRASDDPDIESEPIVRLPRATEAVAPPPAPVMAAAPETPDPLAVESDEDEEDEPLPSGLRDVFGKTEKRSALAGIVDTASAPRSVEVLDEAEQLIASLRRRRAG